MVVCDICKSKEIYDTYQMPRILVYEAQRQGYPVIRINKIETRSIDLCRTCAQNIAELMADMESE